MATLAAPVASTVSRDVDCYVVRETLGVVVGIPPFNFPAMIPLWMMPIAVACGNTFLLKPAEKAPLTGARLVELFAAARTPSPFTRARRSSPSAGSVKSAKLGGHVQLS